MKFAAENPMMTCLPGKLSARVLSWLPWFSWSSPGAATPGAVRQVVVAAAIWVSVTPTALFQDW